MKPKLIIAKEGSRTFAWKRCRKTKSGVIGKFWKEIVPIGLLMLALVGCARFTTHQTDTSTTDKDGKISRTITTKATSTTLFEANSALANFKAAQTDKTQSASVGSLNQAASSTNAVNEAASFLGTLIKTAK